MSLKLPKGSSSLVLKGYHMTELELIKLTAKRNEKHCVDIHEVYSIAVSNLPSLGSSQKAKRLKKINPIRYFPISPFRSYFPNVVPFHARDIFTETARRTSSLFHSTVKLITMLSCHVDCIDRRVKIALF